MLWKRSVIEWAVQEDREEREGTHLAGHLPAAPHPLPAAAVPVPVQVQVQVPTWTLEALGTTRWPPGGRRRRRRRRGEKRATGLRLRGWQGLVNEWPGHCSKGSESSPEAMVRNGSRVEPPHARLGLIASRSAVICVHLDWLLAKL